MLHHPPTTTVRDQRDKRDSMIRDLAHAYGTSHYLWRRMDQDVIERAYSYMLYRWGK